MAEASIPPMAPPMAPAMAPFLGDSASQQSLNSCQLSLPLFCMFLQSSMQQRYYSKFNLIQPIIIELDFMFVILKEMKQLQFVWKFLQLRLHQLIKMISKYRLVASLLTLFLVNLASSTILITSPALNFLPESKIPYSYTNVGEIPYGKTLSFDLKQLPEFKFCSAFDKSNTTLLAEPTYLMINSILSRCSFVTQVLTAQQLGAKGVILVSDYVDYFGKMVLIDDGNGRKVHISVLMIDTKTYEQLKVLKNIQIKVQYEVHTTDKANVTYFLSASGRSNYIFLRQFQPYYQKISSYINFKPVYLTFECLGCSQEDCYISNDYCMFDMDTYSDDVGEEVVKEQIKQWSIWKTYGTSNYLKYMNEFDKLCTSNWLNREDCGDRILRKMELLRPQITEGPSDIMKAWREEEVSSGFISAPELTINSELYAGTQNSTQVFEAICSFLTNPPSECTGQNSIPVKKGNKVAWIVVSIIIACILSIALGLLIYKRCVKKQLTKDMFSKVNELVAKYATKVSDHNKKRKEKIKMSLTEEL